MIWSQNDSVRHALATTPDHEAGKRCSFAVEISVARLGHLSIYERSSPTTDTILHDAVNHFVLLSRCGLLYPKRGLPGKSLATNIEEKVWCPQRDTSNHGANTQLLYRPDSGGCVTRSGTGMLRRVASSIPYPDAPMVRPTEKQSTFIKGDRI